MKTAYPQIRGTCAIRLYSNIPFDNTYQHHSMISDLFTFDDGSIYTSTSNVPAKEKFIDRKDYTKTGNPYYYPRYDLVGEFNFNFSNGLLASVTLELTAPQTNANYLRLTCGNDVYYYFITGITQNNFETYTLSLELDALMTYQDEFLEGMKDVPAFTERKFCYRYDGSEDGIVKCADYKSGDSNFAGIKPSIIKSVDYFDYNDERLQALRNMAWCYVCSDIIDLDPSEQHTDYAEYSFNDKKFPLTMLCFPLNLPAGIETLIIERENDVIDGNNTYSKKFTEYNQLSIRRMVRYLLNNGSLHGCKITPYCPFVDNMMNISVQDSTMTIVFPDAHTTSGSSQWNDKARYWYNTKTTLVSRIGRGTDAEYRFLAIVNEQPYEYNFNHIELNGFQKQGIFNVTDARLPDPKLLFAPFRKYKLCSCYSSGIEIYPELAFSDGYFANTYLDFYSISTCYIGDSSLSTYLRPKPSNNYPLPELFFDSYINDSIGLVANINYNLPVGTNALDVFNSTQAQAFYQSKTASGITSGLTTAGGVASIIGGAVLSATGSGAPVGFGLIAGGLGAVGTGVAGIANTIKSTESKIEDLKNTPDSFNVVGGSFTSDFTKLKDLLPYLITYECTESTKRKADDYFYNYGYEVARECYFNTELSYVNRPSYTIDTKLFNRNIFNYIKLSDDITNKINYDMPIIVKKKLSQVFNNGITLWSFFNFDELWGVGNTPASIYYLDRWFMKCELDNPENDFILR